VISQHVRRSEATHDGREERRRDALVVEIVPIHVAEESVTLDGISVVLPGA
jgi:hypothetical protein